MSDDKGIDLKGGGKTGQTLGVRRDNDMIVFRPSWACGAGTRRFSPAHALELVERIGWTAEFDSWYAANDDHGQAFAVKLVEGRLYCDESPRDDVEGGELPSAPNFSWAQFQRAVAARAKTLKPEAS